MSSFDYTQITNAQMLDWAKALKRTTTKPLDPSSMFNSLVDAKAYIKGDGSDVRGLGKTSYVGQIITVYENGMVTPYQIGLKTELVDGVETEVRVLETIGSGVDLDNLRIVKKETANSGASATYELQLNGVKLGVAIDIPKDLVVSGGSIVTFTDKLPPGVPTVGTYIKITLANSSDILYINVNSLVDVYTSGDEYINVSGYKISLNFDDLVVAVFGSEHFLDKYNLILRNVDDKLKNYATKDEIQIDIATQTTNGLMSSDDKIKVDSIGDVKFLQTNNKTSLVLALNEINAKTIKNNNSIPPFSGFMTDGDRSSIKDENYGVGSFSSDFHVGFDSYNPLSVYYNEVDSHFYYKAGKFFYYNWDFSYLYNTDDELSIGRDDVLFSYNNQHYIMWGGVLKDISIIQSIIDSKIQLVNELPENPIDGVLYCIPE